MRSLKVLSLLCVCFLVCTLILNPCVTYASILTASGSNALMTLDLDDLDYSVMPMSSIGTVKNTIQSDYLDVCSFLYNDSGGTIYQWNRAYKVDGRYSVRASIPDGYIIGNIQVQMASDDLPPPGTYSYSFDMSSQFSYDYFDSALIWYKSINNANTTSGVIGMMGSSSFNSGDVFVNGFLVNITNIDEMRQYIAISEDSQAKYLDISFAINFTKSTSTDAPSTGSASTSADYENDVSSSLSDLSSSVDTMTNEISGVTEAIQNLQGAMEPHYSNVLTQLHHITEQLHAFYDQVYNNIHLPELDMLTQIRTAIENIDLQIEVDISEVKTAINNMSTAVQNKLQSTTDQITGGYDNSQQTQQNQQLQDSINAYDEVEEDIFEDVDGFMEEFEYPSFDSMNGSVIKALAFIGGFLQSIFLSMGDFGTIITFSLTMIFVMIIVGYHRIRS